MAGVAKPVLAAALPPPIALPDWSENGSRMGTRGSRLGESIATTPGCFTCSMQLVLGKLTLPAMVVVTVVLVLPPRLVERRRKVLCDGGRAAITNTKDTIFSPCSWQ
jgi:hypothetical protein